jgi:hypothetical protein
MAGQDWDLNITAVDPNFVYSPAPPANQTGYALGVNKKITVGVSPSILTGTITKLCIYADDGHNQKTGDPLGTWTSAANGANKLDVYHGSTKIYEVKGKNDGTVEIKDTESSNDADEKYHFGTEVCVGTTPYDGDPEMINKGKL